MQKRKRGIRLSSQGLQRLQEAKHRAEVQEKFGNRYTLEELSERTGLTPVTLAKILDGEEKVDKQSLLFCFKAFELKLCEADYEYPTPPNLNTHLPISWDEQLPNLVIRNSKQAHVRYDWGDAVDTSIFYGRVEELVTLKHWVLSDRCRLIGLLGMGGIGKTTLSVKFAQELLSSSPSPFEYVIWRSLDNAPCLNRILKEILQFLSNEQTQSPPEHLEDQLSCLIGYLRRSRCLLILDNVETVLQSGQGKTYSRTGVYRSGYEGYGELFKRVGEMEHQSCLLLTSREKPRELVAAEGERFPVRSFQLQGMNQAGGYEILEAKGLRDSEEEIALLIHYYAGNPLALKIVSATIQDVFGGSITDFLSQETRVFGDIFDLLKQQFDRLSELEQHVMYWLAIAREPNDFLELRNDIISTVSSAKLLEALESLRRRFLIEKAVTGFSLQPIVMEYVNIRFVNQFCDELVELIEGNISSEIPSLPLFASHALIKANAHEYIHDVQVQLILNAVIDGLLTVFQNKANLNDQLLKLLPIVRHNPQLQRSYAGGNILNLLGQLDSNICNCDFSNMAVWQADLRHLKLHQVNFAYADLSKSIFAETFSGISSVTFDSSGELLVLSDGGGAIHLWQVADRQQILTFKGHVGWITSVTFSPNGQMLASGSNDQTIRLWDVNTGQCLQILQGHTDEVRSIVFRLDNQLLVSGGADQTVKIWQLDSGQCLKTLCGHQDWVNSVSLSSIAPILASAGDDQTVRLWQLHTGECLRIFRGHTHRVRAVAFGPDSQTLVSSSADQTMRIWNIDTGNCLHILKGHQHDIGSVAFSPDGQLLASGSDDLTVRVWNVSTGECLKVLQGHVRQIWSVAFSPNGQTLVSGSEDRTVKLWQVETGQCLKTLQGYTHQVHSVAFSPDNQLLASGSEDQTVKLWQVDTGKCLKTLQGHDRWVQSVTFSPDGRYVASAGEDQIVRLWDIDAGQCLQLLKGHTRWIWSVVFSPNGEWLASGSDDKTIKLWSVKTGQCLHTLYGHDGGVWSIAFVPPIANSQLHSHRLVSGSDDQTVRLWNLQTGCCLNVMHKHHRQVWSVAVSPKGDRFCSGSDDQTVKVWDIDTGQCLKTLNGHTSWIRTVAFSPDGQLIASGGNDHTIKLWNPYTGKCLRTLHDHTQQIWSVAFSSDGQILASGSQYEIIKLWDIFTGKCLRTLQSARLYEGTNITGTTGFSKSQQVSLKALGAIEVT